MFEFTIEEMIEQMQDDLECLQNVKTFNQQEYFDYFEKIHPKDEIYILLLQNAKDRFSSGMDIIDIIKIWRKEVKDVQKAL